MRVNVYCIKSRRNKYSDGKASNQEVHGKVEKVKSGAETRFLARDIIWEVGWLVGWSAITRVISRTS